MSAPPVKKAVKAAVRAERAIERAEAKPAGGALNIIKSAVKETGSRLAHEFHPMLGLAADVLLGKQHIMDEAPSRLGKILGGRHSALRGRHKMVVPMSVPTEPTLDDDEEAGPEELGRDEDDERTEDLGNAVGVVNTNMVWQEQRFQARTEDAEESLLVVGATAGPSIVSNGAGSVNLDSSGGLADCSTTSMPYSPDTFNSRPAALATWYARWTPLWWRCIYYPAVPTTAPGAFATGGMLDGTEAGLPATASFAQILQMTPSTAGPYFEKRVLFEMVFKKTQAELFTESDSATLAGQRQTRAAVMLFKSNATLVTPWLNTTMGYTKIEYAFVLTGPSPSFGLMLRFPAAVLGQLKLAIRQAPFALRAELLKANPRMLWLMGSLAEYEAVVESLTATPEVTCPDWVTAAPTSAAAAALAVQKQRPSSARPPSVSGSR